MSYSKKQYNSLTFSLKGAFAVWAELITVFTDSEKKVIKGDELKSFFIKLPEQLSAPQPGEIEYVEEVLEGKLVLFVARRQVIEDESQHSDLLNQY